MRSVEIFAGAGGLALGSEFAGFKPALTVEWDRWACDTLRQNQDRGFQPVAEWKIHEGDVREVDWSQITDISLVTGGPPCQPFSMGGKGRAHDDHRDMFPATAEAIRALRPRAFLIENVRGLTRATFANYFQYIVLRLEHPENVARDGEAWDEHLRRLQSEHTTPSSAGLKYNLVHHVANAADFGVPQQRHRVFFVGFRADLDAEYAFPEETHSFDALMYQQWVTGEYWDRHKVAKRARPDMPGRSATKIAELRARGPEGLLLPWKTVRDAISDLPEPLGNKSDRFLNHRYQPGARSYAGHTGSPLDLPAKALKAGDHGVPGGENMLRRLDGSVRYFTVRESARLQTFPDEYELHGSWSEAMRQLGNAVPVELARIVAASVRTHLVLAAARDTSPVEAQIR